MRAQLNFINEHLGKWLPKFSEMLRAFAATAFYRGLADAIEGMVALDREFLADVLG